MTFDPRLSPFRHPQSNQQREEFWYIYCEWRTRVEAKLVTGVADQPTPGQILINAANEVIDVHPIEHVLKHRNSRPGLMVKWATPIPKWLFLAVERFNQQELDARMQEENNGNRG